MKYFYIYILASKRNGTIYIGVTSNLVKRVWEHKNNLIEGFTKKYFIHKDYMNETKLSDLKALIDNHWSEFEK